MQHRHTTSQPPPSPSAPHVRLVEWPDVMVDRYGTDPWDRTVERDWLPLIGPTAVLLLRHAVQRLDDGGDDLDLLFAAAMLGVRRDRLTRSIDRLVMFRLVRRSGDALAVRRRLPPLTSRQQHRIATQLAKARQIDAPTTQLSSPSGTDRASGSAR
jgi:hypothetical protein